MPVSEPQIRFQQPRSSFSTWVGIVLLFAFFALLVWAVMGAMPRGDKYEEKRAQARLEKLKTAREEADKSRKGYSWVDKQKGTVRMPIDRAMEATMKELAQKKPTAAAPIPPEAAAQPGAQVTAPAGPAPGAPPPAVASPSPKAIAVEGKDSASKGQPAGSANPPSAPPATQPGPSASPPGPPPSQTREFRPDAGPKPLQTPVQSPPGSPLPVRGKTP